MNLIYGHKFAINCAHLTEVRAVDSHDLLFCYGDISKTLSCSSERTRNILFQRIVEFLKAIGRGGFIESFDLRDHLETIDKKLKEDDDELTR